jgi:hypothetical protein
MGTRDVAVRSIKLTFVATTKRALLLGLASGGPFFANSVVQNVASIVLDRILNWLANQAEMGVFFQFIDWRGAQQSEAFVKAADENRKAQESGTKEERERAEKNLWDAASNFIRFTA